MNDRCRQRNLTRLAAQLPQLVAAARCEPLSYEAFWQRALAEERHGRAARAQARRVRAARLPVPARLEHFACRFQPTVAERMIRELARVQLQETATHGVRLGPPGVGKTH
jgi:DNA replication protein DnaC